MTTQNSSQPIHTPPILHYTNLNINIQQQQKNQTGLPRASSTLSERDFPFYSHYLLSLLISLLESERNWDKKIVLCKWYGGFLFSEHEEGTGRKTTTKTQAMVNFCIEIEMWREKCVRIIWMGFYLAFFLGFLKFQEQNWSFLKLLEIFH